MFEYIYTVIPSVILYFNISVSPQSLDSRPPVGRHWIVGLNQWEGSMGYTCVCVCVCVCVCERERERDCVFIPPPPQRGAPRIDQFKHIRKNKFKIKQYDLKLICFSQSAPFTYLQLMCFCSFQNAGSQFFFVFFLTTETVLQNADFQNYLISIRKLNESKKLKHLKRWVFCHVLFSFPSSFFFSFNFYYHFISLHGKKLVCKLERFTEWLLKIKFYQYEYTLA